MEAIKFVVVIILFTAIQCSTYDDGKYYPKKYGDDGKYYRPLDEGKYIPGDEGRYTYVYRQGLYPDYPYVHVVGPNGGNGGNGGYGGNGLDGSNSPGGQNGPDRSDKIEYIGRKIYAEKYPYLHKVIKALIEKYVSNNSAFGEIPEGTVIHYLKALADKEAVKCQYFNSKIGNHEYIAEPANHLPLNGTNSKPGYFYSFKGTKILKKIDRAYLKRNIKLDYEVYIRMVDEHIE